MSLVAAIVVTATTQIMLGGVVEAISYWEAQVGAMATCHIPTDHPGGNVKTGS